LCYFLINSGRIITEMGGMVKVFLVNFRVVREAAHGM
jgi:hypothetical protein